MNSKTTGTFTTQVTSQNYQFNLSDFALFPRATSQTDALVHPLGDCRESQIPHRSRRFKFEVPLLAVGCLTFICHEE